jgi:hypothetical protein
MEQKQAVFSHAYDLPLFIQPRPGPSRRKSVLRFTSSSYRYEPGRWCLTGRGRSGPHRCGVSGSGYSSCTMEAPRSVGCDPPASKSRFGSKRSYQSIQQRTHRPAKAGSSQFSAIALGSAGLIGGVAPERVELTHYQEAMVVFIQGEQLHLAACRTGLGQGIRRSARRPARRP